MILPVILSIFHSSAFLLPITVIVSTHCKYTSIGAMAIGGPLMHRVWISRQREGYLEISNHSKELDYCPKSAVSHG